MEAIKGIMNVCTCCVDAAADGVKQGAGVKQVRLGIMSKLLILLWVCSACNALNDTGVDKT